jgi:hypothetical protein
MLSRDCSLSSSHTNECIWDNERRVFRVTRTKGNTLVTGGYGFFLPVSFPPRSSGKRSWQTFAEASSLSSSHDCNALLLDCAGGRPFLSSNDRTGSNNINNDVDDNLSRTGTVTRSDGLPLMDCATHNTIDQTSRYNVMLDTASIIAESINLPKCKALSAHHYLFIEDVIFLHERGLIDCYQEAAIEPSATNERVKDDAASLGENIVEDASNCIENVEPVASAVLSAKKGNNHHRLVTEFTSSETRRSPEQKKKWNRFSGYDLFQKMLTESAIANLTETLIFPIESSTSPTFFSSTANNTMARTNHCLLPFAVYRVYAYLRQQDFRVVRHTPRRCTYLNALQTLSNKGMAGKRRKRITKKIEAGAIIHALPVNEGSSVESSLDRECAKCSMTREKAETDAEQKSDGSQAYKFEITQREDKAVAAIGDRSRQPRCHSLYQVFRHNLRVETATASPPSFAYSLGKGLDKPSCRLEGPLQFAWDVYLPNSKFCPTNPGLPDYHVLVTPYNNSEVTVSSLYSCILHAKGVPAKIAAVSDAGTVLVFGLSTKVVPPEITR